MLLFQLLNSVVVLFSPLAPLNLFQRLCPGTSLFQNLLIFFHAFKKCLSYIEQCRGLPPGFARKKSLLAGIGALFVYLGSVGCTKIILPFPLYYLSCSRLLRFLSMLLHPGTGMVSLLTSRYLWWLEQNRHGWQCSAVVTGVLSMGLGSPKSSFINKRS